MWFISCFLFPLTSQVGKVLGGESTNNCGEREGHLERTLHQLLGLKEALEMPHLPDASEDEDDGLSDGPPQDPLVGALTGQTEALFTILWDSRPRTKCAGKTSPGCVSHPLP